MTDAPPTQRATLPTGLALDYIDIGQGPLVVLLHGGMGDCHSWEPQLAAFRQTHRVVAYSRRHSSGSAAATDAGVHSLDTDVEDLAAFARALHLGPAHLVGTSYGALTALAFALRHPSDVLSLCLAEPPLHRWCEQTKAGARLFAEFMDSVWLPARAAFASGDDAHAMQLLTDGIWGRPVFDTLDPPRRAAALRNAAAMRALTQSRDPFPDLPRAMVAAIAVPTLLIRGQHASALHRCGVDALKHAIPHARLNVIGDAGHGAAFERPAEFNATVLRFLADATGQGA